MQDPLTFDFDIDMERLLRAMDTPDDVGSVLRVHLELERALDHLIDRIRPKPEKAGWRYPSQKIQFLLAFGIPEFRLEPAQIINAVRNSFTHRERKESIEKGDVKKLFDSLNKVTGERITEEYVFVRKSRSLDQEVSRKVYKDMSTREQFCFLGFLAIGVTAVIENEIKRANPS